MNRPVQEDGGCLSSLDDRKQQCGETICVDRTGKDPLLEGKEEKKNMNV